MGLLKKGSSLAGQGRLRLLAVVGGVAALATTACGLSAGSPVSAGKVEVVAAENFWGSIATQVGGDHAHVTSVIVNPDTDPHDYEPTPADAKLIAGARYVIVNGAGYDSWAPKLLAANPVSGRIVLTVGDFIGKKEGDNPHMWYSPAYVERVVDKIASDLAAIDSGDASYFDQQKTAYKTTGLMAYHDTINAIKTKYKGTPVGATESIFSYMATDTGLNLITPSDYLKAISEGTDPSPSDKATVLQQIRGKKIKVFVFNSQNSTPDVKSLVDKARAQGIPVARVTETLAPANVTFQDWQTNQLKELLAALGG
ncbi:MAG TPA: zinc ABC transporter substrate-binding protein [Candidatus Dormibacteraeota bacterium]|nr:zinc ABC transporter substrate-binding protein [Candidatus Dormibacteraeota bacterium]